MFSLEYVVNPIPTFRTKSSSGPDGALVVPAIQSPGHVIERLSLKQGINNSLDHKVQAAQAALAAANASAPQNAINNSQASVNDPMRSFSTSLTEAQAGILVTTDQKIIAVVMQ